MKAPSPWRRSWTISDFITYESTESLAAKLDYIKANGLGGLIIWEVHGDSIDNDWPMITQMHKGLQP